MACAKFLTVQHALVSVLLQPDLKRLTS